MAAPDMHDGTDVILAGPYVARARMEYNSLAERGFLLAGHGFPRLLCVKGVPGDAEKQGKPLLSGPDGAALRAGFDRLGYASDAWGACSSFVVKPSGSMEPADPLDLAEAVEVFDPEVVVVLDDAAARALSIAWQLEPSCMTPGVRLRVHGRVVVPLGGFEAALQDTASKRIVWNRLKLAAPLASPLSS